MKNTSAIIVLLLLSSFQLAFAQPGAPPPPPPNGNGMEPLGDVPVPDENPITEEKRVLGKILFWDEQLSSDNTVACGTCHRPAAGGADSRLALNPGFDQLFGTDDDVIGSAGIRALDVNGDALNDPMFGHGPQVTGRATPSFFTSMFADSNFWDGRASDEFIDPLDESNIVIAEGGALESQAVGPILSTVEMAKQGRSWSDVVAKLQSVDPLALASNIPEDMLDALQGGQNYPDLFSAAFGDTEITPVRIAFAIATYERTLVPNDTPWDRYVAGDSSAMTPNQISGWELYLDSPCANCHEPPLFSDDNFRNIGLRPSIEDLGEFEITGQNNDRGDFKTPSLRNAGLRRALMHVGWVTDIADAIDFYNAGTKVTGHVQFTQDQSGIPGTNVDIDEIDVFGDDPLTRGHVIDFLMNGLTDDRAATESFPFDRPILWSESNDFFPFVNFEIAGAVSDGSNTAAVYSAVIVSDSELNEQNRFLSTDSVTINAQITIDPQDVGVTGNFYCVIVVDNEIFVVDSEGSLRSWEDGSELPHTATRELASVEMISVLDDVEDLSGDIEVYVGYDLQDGVIRYNAESIRITIL